MKDFSPKPWPERFREIQAAGGHVEIVQSRIQQGELIAVAAGTLGLNASGRIDGELQMTVAGIEKVIPALGIEKMLEEGVPQATLDRVAPGVKTPGPQQSVRRARPRDPRARQGRQAERQCRRRRRHQRARQGSGAGRQEGARLPAALRRRRGVSRPAEGRRRCRRCSRASRRRAGLNEAGEDYRVAFARDPNNEEILVSWSNVDLRLRRMNDYKRRVEQAYALNQQNPRVLRTVDALLFNFGERDKAFEFYSKAIEVDPTEGFALYYRAREYSFKAQIGGGDRGRECAPRRFAGWAQRRAELSRRGRDRSRFPRHCAA